MEERDWRNPSSTNSAREDLTKLRDKIDEIDQQVAVLLKERLLAAREIGDVKAKAGIAVTDNGREQAVIENVRNAVGDEQLADAICKVYASLLEQSRNLQKPVVNAAACAGKVYFPRVLIIGVGLIGGALARQIKRRMPGTTVIGWDKPEVLTQAIAETVIDEAAMDLATAVPKASLVILCAGPKQNLQLLAEIAPFTKRRQIVVDVTSAKSKICKAASKLALKADFIGGHPFFGSHKSGLTNSAELDIDNKRFCLTPTKRSSEIGVARLSRWLTELGLKVQNIDAARHDESVAATSHLVQLLAISLGAMMSENKTDQELKDQLALSGPSLQALSRLMASPSPLWIDIVDQNSEAVIAAIEMLQQRLTIMVRAIETGDATKLDDEFKLAQRVPGLLQ